MVFSSPVFLFIFLPLVLLSNLLTPPRWRNIQLLLFSLLFYAWGEVFYTLVMLAVICVIFVIAGRFSGNQSTTDRHLLFIGTAVTLAPLLFFKYSGFLADNLGLGSLIPQGLGFTQHLHLPLGISFYTFQAISYLVDTYRGSCSVSKSFTETALYVSLFPQLVAGPIVRYKDIARQLRERSTSIDNFSQGVRRFIVGLGKKTLIANPLGYFADTAFSLPPHEVSFLCGWLGAISFSLQIYFDFSGYSDMAIGLGRMFGFTIPENFDRPYLSQSIKEFWRRWHMSLSSWFRDYLYIPLGGNRLGPKRTMLNLLLVFFLCGLWHGAAWTFVFWGLYHGFFLIIERGRFGQRLSASPRPFRHLYAMLVVLFGWVFFRADTLSQAFGYCFTMLSFDLGQSLDYRLAMALTPHFVLVLCIALFLCTPLPPALTRLLVPGNGVGNRSILILHNFVENVFLLSVLVFSMASLAMQAYNPFIYFRF